MDAEVMKLKKKLIEQVINNKKLIDVNKVQGVTNKILRDQLKKHQAIRAEIKTYGSSPIPAIPVEILKAFQEGRLPEVVDGKVRGDNADPLDDIRELEEQSRRLSQSEKERAKGTHLAELMAGENFKGLCEKYRQVKEHYRGFKLMVAGFIRHLRIIQQRNTGLDIFTPLESLMEELENAGAFNPDFTDAEIEEIFGGIENVPLSLLSETQIKKKKEIEEGGHVVATFHADGRIKT